MKAKKPNQLELVGNRILGGGTTRFPHICWTPTIARYHRLRSEQINGRTVLLSGIRDSRPIYADGLNACQRPPRVEPTLSAATAGLLANHSRCSGLLRCCCRRDPEELGPVQLFLCALLSASAVRRDISVAGKVSLRSDG